jgi:hypothetical protein
MPCISSFYGLLIYMYGDDHNPPHFHVNYGGKWSVFDFDGNLTEGELPVAKQKLVSAWVEIHRDELIANWELTKNKEVPAKILPLQ